MEKIGEMMKRMCPEGVEKVRLGELGTFENIGVDKKIVEGEQEVILLNYVDVYHNKYINSSTPTMIVTASEKKRTACNVLKGDIFVTPTSETVDDIGHSSVATDDIPNCVYSYHIMRFRQKNPNEVTSFYINYLFDLVIVKQQILKKAQGLTRFGLSKDKFASISIPLPPLPIQQEIVRILDSFTSMITNLETELASRQKQYEYYRNKLLTFDENDKSVEWKTLGEIGTIVRGNGLQKTDFSEEGVGCVHYGQIYTRLGFSIDKTLTFVPEELAEKLTQIEPGNLIIACTSENVEDVCKSVVWLGTENIVTGGHACVFKHNENPKYVGYCFLTNDFFNQKKKYAYGAKVIDIKTEKLSLIKIPVPNRNIQDEIVEKLDTFESLITNIKQELEARKKQYEYYREQLLTFE